MKVAVTICSRNRASNLQKTLESLTRPGVLDGADVAVTVVDNGSTDNTAEVVRMSALQKLVPIRYVVEPARGVASARNAGVVAGAKSDLILFTDDDVHPPVGWVRDMSAPVAEGTAEAVWGGVRMAPHLQRPWMDVMHRAMISDTTNENHFLTGSMLCANMAFSTEVLQKVPRFDPELGPGALGFAEDSLFSMQIREAGYRFAHLSNVEVEHHFQEERLSYAAFMDTAAKHGRSSAYVQYHWFHFGQSHVRLHLLRKRVQLRLWHMLKPPAADGSVSSREIHHTRSRWLYDQFMKEIGTPRKYELRGLVKLPG